MKTITIIAFLYVFSLFHAEHLAEYQYQLIDNQLNLRFVIEKAEIDSFNFNSDCDFTQMTALCMTEYINDHTSITINNEKINLKLQDSYIENEHFIVNLNAMLSLKEVETIMISNHCFYEFNPSFKNRIILDIDSFQKSYMLTANKNKISLK